MELWIVEVEVRGEVLLRSRVFMYLLAGTPLRTVPSSVLSSSSSL